MQNNIGISVFFPAYNDAESIAYMVESAFSTLKKITHDYEIIVVNDGSRDKTKVVLDALSNKYKQLKVIHHRMNKGYGAALKSGFANSNKELIFYTDGDGQYDIKDLNRLLPSIKDCDIVNGYKIVRNDPMYRKVFGEFYRWMAKIVFDLKINDVDCDFRLMKRRVFQKIRLESDSGAICIEMIKKFEMAGFIIKELPVNHYKRLHGRSTFFTPSNLLKTIKELAKLWWELFVIKNN
jgi:glycosyltransferase involved in cell wall biosynthesis